MTTMGEQALVSAFAELMECGKPFELRWSPHNGWVACVPMPQPGLWKSTLDDTPCDDPVAALRGAIKLHNETYARPSANP